MPMIIAPFLVSSSVVTPELESENLFFCFFVFLAMIIAPCFGSSSVVSPELESKKFCKSVS